MEICVLVSQILHVIDYLIVIFIILLFSIIYLNERLESVWESLLWNAKQYDASVKLV